mgnify:CR=1 FL=1
MALGAPVIQVWASKRDHAGADAAYCATVVADALRIADIATAPGIAIGFDYHGGTLTATDAETQCDHPALGTFWQPHVGADTATARPG